MGKRDESPAAPPVPAGRRRCPICGKPVAPRHRPFCSARCADIDLGRWLKGNYHIASEEPPGDADADRDDSSGGG